MKRNSRRGLAFLLTFVLIGAAGVLPAFPVSAETENVTQNTGVQKPEVIEKTTDSIKLRTEQDFEYAIETEKDNARIWKWAETGQYDKASRTVVFTGLQPGTQYSFACRHAGEDVILYQNTAATNAIAADVVTDTPQNQPLDPSEVTDALPDETKKLTDGNQNSEGEEAKLSPTDEVQNSAGETEKPPEGIKDTFDANKQLSDDTIKEADDSQNFSDSAKKPADEKKDKGVTKAPAPPLTAPEAPIVKEVKDTEVTLELPQNADPKYNYEFSINGTDFQADPRFDKLTPDTSYQCYLRIAAGKYEGVTYLASGSSEPIDTRTKRSAPDKPEYTPEAADRTNTSISLKVPEMEKNPDNMEFGMLGSGTDIEWNTTGVFDNLTPGTEYQFVVRRKVDEKLQMQGENSDILHVATLENAAAAALAPKILKRSDTSIVLITDDKLEYGMRMADGTISWQENAEFAGLEPDTEYQFMTRAKYDPDKAMESLPSETVKYRTAISSDGVKITGIEHGGTYEAETVWTATAVGVGMENTSPAVGDTRWAPKTWTWGGAIKSWENPPYTVKFKCTRLGSYELTAGFQMEEYTGKGWKETEYKKSVSTSFNIIEKKVTVYTITAEAGANGKIDPNGRVDVEKGKSCEFTFSPNRGYRVAKVLVDGREVTMKNNRYTLTDVQDNHKISVTFEKDKSTPKTGDNTQFVIILGAFLISGMAVLMLAYRKRKR